MGLENLEDLLRIEYLTIHCSLPLAEERKVFIGMIPKTYTNEDLLRMLEPHGTIEELNILKSADGKSKGMYVCWSVYVFV